MRSYPDTPRLRTTARVPFTFNEGELADVEITDLAYGGAGIGRVEGFVLLVRRGLPGDLLRVRIVSRKPKYAEAEIVDRLDRSPLAVAPRCASFEPCGGCQWMHLAYEHQLDTKERLVGQTLERIGGLSEFTLHRIVRSPEIYRYRNKLEMAFGMGPAGLVLGFHREGSEQDIVDIPTCLIASERMDRIAAEARRFLSEKGYEPAPWTTENGNGNGNNGRSHAAAPGAPAGPNPGNGKPPAERAILRHLVLREGRRTGEMLVDLSTTDAPFPDEKEFARALTSAHPWVVGVVHSMIPMRRGAGGRKEKILAGRGTVREMLGGICYDITAGSFFQVNTEQAENLYQRARDMGVQRGDAVLDLYCGVGGLTLFLASRARRVLGIENVPEAIACAEANAAANDIGNVRFLQAEARRAVQRLAAGGKTYDVVTVNPPRSGVHEDILDGLPALAPRRIVYVSCNPTTLARDLSGLVKRGFRLTDVQPVDMFPHSYHVETIARLERQG